jgi:hypothetical protein
MKLSIFTVQLLLISSTFNLPFCSEKPVKDPLARIQKKTVQQIKPCTDYIYLESIYATNTMLPTGTYNVLHIIDNDESTVWQTPAGSGSQEGIMLRFSKPVFIGGLSLKAENITSHTVYCDGTIYSDKKDGTESTINTKLTSLFIKINDVTANTTVKNYSINSSDDDESTYDNTNSTQKYYNKDYSIRVSELQLYDKSGKRLNIAQPKAVTCSLFASSVLSPEHSYSPYLLVDGTTSFGWAEGAKGKGENEWVRFVFAKDISITKLKIWGGYQRSNSHFYNNARPEMITLSVKGINTVFTFTLKDSSTSTELILPDPLTGKSFELKILSSYPGKKYEDLAISEILFFEGNTPVYPVCSFEDNIVKYSRSIKSRCFQNTLDRLINIEQNRTYSDPESGFNSINSISLIIRSNKSFVFYEDNIDDNGVYDSSGTSTIAEGGWELISATDSVATIRIFGKHYVTGSKRVLYKGVTGFNRTNIFQDIVTITDTQIKGDRFIKDYRLLWGNE